MATIRKTASELRRAAPKFTGEQRARLETDKDGIDARAQADEINPAWTDTDLDRAVFARMVRQARSKLGMTQPAFAASFHISLRRLHDWEQARHKPDSVAAAYIRTILHAPKIVEKALRTKLVLKPVESSRHRRD